MEVKVTLSIGYCNANREDTIEIDDTEYAECETKEERQELLNDYWQDWANNYIEGSFDII